jgi:hypothetical protein
VNTFLAMAIDAETRRPRIANVTAGLSGPAIKPIALRMVYDAARAVKIPVIGMGGISTPADVVEFMLAGRKRRGGGNRELLRSGGDRNAGAGTDRLLPRTSHRAAQRSDRRLADGLTRSLSGGGRDALIVSPCGKHVSWRGSAPLDGAKPRHHTNKNAASSVSTGRCIDWKLSAAGVPDRSRRLIVQSFAPHYMGFAAVIDRESKIVAKGKTEALLPDITVAWRIA